MVFIRHIDVFDGLTRVVLLILYELKMYADKKKNVRLLMLRELASE